MHFFLPAFLSLALASRNIPQPKNSLVYDATLVSPQVDITKPVDTDLLRAIVDEFIAKH